MRAELCPRAETPGASYATASVAAARLIGLQVGKRAAQRGVNVVLWDRPGKYHGKIKAFIDAVRECGVQTRMAMRKEMPGEQKV